MTSKCSSDMDLVEPIWRNLELSMQYGAMRRVSENSTADFFCGLDSTGRRGLILVSATEPPVAPTFTSVEIIVSRRTDGHWALTMWLNDPRLESVFSTFCDSLIEAVSSYASLYRAAEMLTYILNSKRLLEESTPSLLSVQRIRGLIGELLAFKESLALYPVEIVLSSWTGPFRTPQDFAFPRLFVEVKAVVPTATTVKISSFDQLDRSEDVAIVLVVYVLAEILPNAFSNGQLSLSALVGELQLLLKADPILINDFTQKLKAAGYQDDPYYDTRTFRVESKFYFAVGTKFPKIGRAQIPNGVTDGVYHIALANCLQHRQETIFTK